jgi:uncharacterized membrane protein YbhN (UPF0104 family)
MRKLTSPEGGGGHTAPAKAGWWGPTTRRALTLLLVGAVLVLLARYARSVDWGAVVATLRAYPAQTLVAALACAGASHLVYCSYDLIGRWQVRHHLSAGKVAAVASVSYAFNLSLGSWVGAVALRYRLYSRFGLSTHAITQVLALSLVSNWLGYLALAGSVFLVYPLALPDDWAVGRQGLRLIGLVYLGLAAAYLGLCFTARRRRWTVRGHPFTLPSGRVALLQLGVACTNWLLMAGIIAVLLSGKLDYPTVLNVLLIAAVAGVISHVPAGLGVIEAVFVVLLSHRVPATELLAALVGYRALYYLAPLCVATVVYLVLEARAGRGARSARRRR